MENTTQAVSPKRIRNLYYLLPTLGLVCGYIVSIFAFMFIPTLYKFFHHEPVGNSADAWAGLGLVVFLYMYILFSLGAVAFATPSLVFSILAIKRNISENKNIHITFITFYGILVFALITAVLVAYLI